MSLLASIVVTGALISPPHMDADAQGRAVLGWTRWGQKGMVVEVADVRDGRLAGRPQRLWTKRERAVLEDLDVAASGAAVACLRHERTLNSSTWTVRVAVRAPGGAWSRLRKVAADGSEITCGVSDSGAAVVAWQEGRRRAVRVVDVAADGTVGRPVTITRDPVDEGVVEVGPAGSAAVVYTKRDRVVRLAQRAAAGRWHKRSFGPERGYLPKLAMSASGQPLVAWRRENDELRLVTGPDFAPTTFTAERDVAVESVVTGARGDALITYITHSSGYGPPSALGVSVARPGAPFAPATLLGPFEAYPREAALAADGSGAVAWYERSAVVLRKLGVDGGWAAPVPITGVSWGDLQLSAAPGGVVTAAWQERDAEGRDVLRLAAF